MKILIITRDVGKTAPGIVFERIIHGLSKIHTVDVLTCDFAPSFELSGVRRIMEIKRGNIPGKIDKMFISFFAVYPMDLVWKKRAIAYLNRHGHSDYDLVFSFICFSYYTPLLTGNSIAKKLQIKHMVYSVDAIPAPIGWLKDDLFYKGTKRLMAKHLSEIDGLFSANEKMLQYQLTTFTPKKKIISDVIYNPSYGDAKNFTNSSSDKYTFLFTGGLYGPRKPEYVLGAFKMILKEYPNATLEFVGSALSNNSFSGLDPEERKQIFIHPFTKDLAPFYERATALLDIDADLPDDVFLSSKITNYITANRIIISETGDNSPSRNIFKGIPSILQCGHNVDEIANAMRLAIQQKNIIDFKDRAKVISLFNVDTVIEKINNKISA